MTHTLADDHFLHSCDSAEINAEQTLLKTYNFLIHKYIYIYIYIHTHTHIHPVRELIVCQCEHVFTHYTCSILNTVPYLYLKCTWRFGSWSCSRLQIKVSRLFLNPTRTSHIISNNTNNKPRKKKASTWNESHSTCDDLCECRRVSIGEA